jgi:hypothetical protein
MAANMYFPVTGFAAPTTNDEETGVKRPSGKIARLLAATSHIDTLASVYPMAPLQANAHPARAANDRVGILELRVRVDSKSSAGIDRIVIPIARTACHDPVVVHTMAPVVGLELAALQYDVISKNLRSVLTGITPQMSSVLTGPIAQFTDGEDSYAGLFFRVACFMTELAYGCNLAVVPNVNQLNSTWPRGDPGMSWRPSNTMSSARTFGPC